MTHHKISASTLARTAALALALTNQVLSAVGKPMLPIESAQLEQLISSGLTVAAALASWWNNNSFTPEAIECCIPDDTGRFNDATYQTLVHLVAWLCGRYDLTMDDVIRHYDVTGKNCPKYYVEHEDAWKQFKVDVADYIEKNGVDPENLKNDK